MAASRPLLYLSLPTVAFIVGVFWFRRRNKTTCNENKKMKHSKAEIEEDTEIQVVCKSNIDTQISTSMNIDCTNNEHNNQAVKLLGKSAPIKIVQNGKGSPLYNSDKQSQIDSEMLKLKIMDADCKALKAIDEDFENLSSSVDLPDSVHNRVSFYSRNVLRKKDEPVVIKATKSAKITPENSFLECKYAKENEHNDNCTTKQNNHENNAQEVINKEDELNNNDSSEKRNEDTASPSLSLCSVHSGDSGKGSSLPRSEATRPKTAYEFFFPNSLVGQLYGRKRSFINHIKTKTSANVILRRNPFTSKVKICVIEGTESQINAALTLIRQRLPAKHYPNFTMQRIHFALPQTIVPLSSENISCLQLSLIEGINNDVVVSAIISGGHIFVQQPLHPSHPSLDVLQKYLYDNYNNIESPMLPRIEIGAVCVLRVNSIWYRVQIIKEDPEDDKRCIVKILDFGGYVNAHFNDLRQIRTDFMGTPFQATECILSNIQPKDSVWSFEAADVLAKFTRGIVLQAQVAGYNSQNIPEILLFSCLAPNTVIFINKELVARNLAEWVEERD